jgi:hypothetical protein
MTDWSDAIHRGVEALDFRPRGLNAKAARPPEDADGLQAMLAAIKFHDMLPTFAGRHLGANAALEVHREFGTLENSGSPAHELEPLLRRYRMALTAALQEYAEGDGTAKIAELVRWYDQDRKAVDG